MISSPVSLILLSLLLQSRSTLAFYLSSAAAASWKAKRSDISGVSPLFLVSPSSSRHGANFKIFLDQYDHDTVDKNDYTDSVPVVGLLLNPESPESQRLVMSSLGLSEQQYQQLVQLSFLVCDWNTRINLVSRKDCTPSVVWTRHILPSVAAAAAATESPLLGAKRVVDVGTGGGFPGLPLAIAYPATTFVLLDSVGKKLVAVQDMADQLGLSNVETYHGRAEEYRSTHKFDVATGRSVSSLPQFCSWMHHLIAKESGHLMYWIGGGPDIPNDITELCKSNVAIEPLLEHLVVSDKRILTFDRSAVLQIAAQSGTTNKAPLSSRRTRPPSSSPTNSNNNNAKTRDSEGKQRRDSNYRSNNNKRRLSSSSTATWQRRRDDDDAEKDRGYENFKRYSSTGSTGNTSDDQ